MAKAFEVGAVGYSCAHVFWRFALTREIWIRLVPVQDCAFGSWPFNRKGRVIPPNTPRIIRRIELRDLVEDFGVVLEGLKSMSEVFRNIQRFAVVGGKFHTKVLLERRRFWTKVNYHVVDCSAAAAYELYFLVGRRL